MNVRTKRAGTKRTKDTPDIIGLELTSEDALDVVASVCMICNRTYRVRVIERAHGYNKNDLRYSHGYCTDHEPTDI